VTDPACAFLDESAGVRALRDRAGFSVSETATVAEISGADRVRFLQSQLPIDVEALTEGHGAYTARLDRKGRIAADLVLLHAGESLLLLVDPQRLPATLESFEHHHFREDVTMRDRSEDFAVWELHGPSTPTILARLLGQRAPLETHSHRLFAIAGVTRASAVAVRWVADPWTGDVGGRFIVPREHAALVRAALLEAGLPEGLVEIGPAALEILRIEGGRPRQGIDIDERTLLLELGRDEMVSFNKGCYVGQETVARVHARGHVNRLFMGLLMEEGDVPVSGALVHLGDVPVGETRSACWSPSLRRPIALAWLRREAAEPGTVVHVRAGSAHIAATVTALPLYRPPGPAEQAETHYRRGMEAFTEDRFEAAIAEFERATFMNPHHAAAFEAIGVCLERLGRLDEAIEIMRGLTESDPQNVMAWTNLSRYHAQQGHIEEAERLKGQVAYLIWKRELGEKAAARKSAQDDAAHRARLEERIVLFRQVLDMDPDDVIANFGLGKTYLDLERYDEAVPHFRRAIEGQRDYSMAFNHMGTCLVRLGRREEAEAVLREGIVVAAARGDLIPRREMARKLEELTA
jgi:folate-binding protein YgfZ